MIKKFFSKVISAVALASMVSIAASSLPVRADDNDNIFTDSDKFSQWEVVGPAGGDVRVVTIDPRDKNKMYLSTMDGQIHASSDGGNTWRLLANLNSPQLVLDQLIGQLGSVPTPLGPGSGMV